ncbi:coenzyme F420-0:L-glutamate ligase [Patescibacteria group bacterium]|nr:coenzyme F420-0:L-glutamate ligase [Patescibacteria group bacterium]
MLDTFVPNEGKTLEAIAGGKRYLRLPIKTRIVKPHDDLMRLLEEYVQPRIEPGDIFFVSEKIVCICQGRVIRRDAVVTSWLARFLASKVRNYEGTPEFRGLGHGTAPAMQLVIDEAGYPRVLFAAAVSALTRAWLPGAFYFLIGKQAKSVDCPMSWTIKPFDEYAKRAPQEPEKVAREIKEKLGIEAVVVDANYRGAFSLGKSTPAITETFIRELLRDNPAGQDSEMTPFFLIRKARD